MHVVMQKHGLTLADSMNDSKRSLWSNVVFTDYRSGRAGSLCRVVDSMITYHTSTLHFLALLLSSVPNTSETIVINLGFRERDLSLSNYPVFISVDVDVSSFR